MSQFTRLKLIATAVLFIGAMVFVMPGAWASFKADRGSAEVGLERIKYVVLTTGKIGIHAVDTTVDVDQLVSISDRAPVGRVILYTDEAKPRPIVVVKRAVFTGKMINDASVGFDKESNRHFVRLKLDSAHRIIHEPPFGQKSNLVLGLDDKIISDSILDYREQSEITVYLRGLKNEAENFAGFAGNDLLASDAVNPMRNTPNEHLFIPPPDQGQNWN